MLVSSVQFKPEMIGMYCHGAVNAVHTDPVVAQEFGYEAPIWGGMQGGHILRNSVGTIVLSDRKSVSPE